MVLDFPHPPKDVLIKFRRFRISPKLGIRVQDSVIKARGFVSKVRGLGFGV